MKYEDRKQTTEKVGMVWKSWSLAMHRQGWLCTCFAAVFFTLHSSLFISTAGAQNFVSAIKVVAIQDKDSLSNATDGYSGANNLDLDFRKGVGGGYVFVVQKYANDTATYITDVVVTADKKEMYGQKFKDDDGRQYYPAEFFQAKERHDKNYRGGLNGRDYSIYGGAYIEQPHIYFTHSGYDDFNNKVLKNIDVYTSKPEKVLSDQTMSGGHGGGKRYLVFTWHTHEPKYKSTGDVNTHVHYCDHEQCGLKIIEPHNFSKLYDNDMWMIFPKTGTRRDTLIAQSHYKKCKDCGQVVTDQHKFATFSANWETHEKRCIICDYVEESDHKNFGKEKIPVDEYYHIIYCGDCGFIEKLRHDYSENRVIKRQNCEYTFAEYTCKKCYHHEYFEEPGVGHNFDENGICRRQNCLHPYQQPGVEPLDSLGNDSVFVIKNFGNLYWASDYVNNRRPKANIRLDRDLIAESYIAKPWLPIGDTDSTAYQGTFDGNGHVISMLQTEEPVAGCASRGLFGFIGKNGTVKNLSITNCNMRGWDNIGAVAGVNEGKIDKCQVVFSQMNSIGTGMNIGGICGLNKGTISGCTTGKDVWVGGVRDYAGGICGTNDGGTLSGNVFEAICGSGSDATLPETASQQ